MTFPGVRGEGGGGGGELTCARRATINQAVRNQIARGDILPVTSYLMYFAKNGKCRSVERL